MQNGRPLNNRHPGYKKLPPQEQEDFDKLEQQKKQNGGTLPEKDAEDLEKLAGTI